MAGIRRDDRQLREPMPDYTSPDAGKNGVDRFRTAQTLLAKGAPLHALTELEPLLREQPRSRSVLELAARAYFKSAQLGRAEQAFARLVELDPTDSYARFALGRSVERQSRHAEAAGHYRVACALDPRDDYREALERVQRRI
jgi:Flp pilus assembly protein TadD